MRLLAFVVAWLPLSGALGQELRGYFELRDYLDASFGGTEQEGYAGWDVSSAGDFDGDGFDDILIGAVGEHAGRPFREHGAVYLLFGKGDEDPWSGAHSLASAAVIFAGIDAYDRAGSRVESAGDFNGDGYDDLLISAPRAESRAGETYLIYGRQRSAIASNHFNLADADVTFVGPAPQTYTGQTISSGDFNGDGLDDLLFGSASNDGRTADAFLVYGRREKMAASFDLAAADAVFRNEGEQSPIFPNGPHNNVASAGDVNGDGVMDALFTNHGADSGLGEIHLVFGTSIDGGHRGMIDLAQADVTFRGTLPEGYPGSALASAGDIDGDGYDDILIGAPSADNFDPRYQFLFEDAGLAYLIYGREESEFGGGYDLSQSDVVFFGDLMGDEAGIDVAGAGDVNGDGYDDFLIGSRYGGPILDPRRQAGETYLFYGGNAGGRLGGTINVADADAVFHGVESRSTAGRRVASAGDVNGDGLADILIGAYQVDEPLYFDNRDFLLQTGEAYLIYGRRVVAEPSTIHGWLAFVLLLGLRCGGPNWGRPYFRRDSHAK